MYAPLTKFSLSSLLAFGVDMAMLFTLVAVTGNLLLSVVGARVVSSVVNFAKNRRLVFGERCGRSVTASAVRYFALVAVVLAANYGLMHLLHERMDVALLPSKLVTETLLFALSYQVQNHLVFAHHVSLTDPWRMRGGQPAVDRDGSTGAASKGRFGLVPRRGGQGDARSCRSAATLAERPDSRAS